MGKAIEFAIGPSIAPVFKHSKARADGNRVTVTGAYGRNAHVDCVFEVFGDAMAAEIARRWNAYEPKPGGAS